jgi:predicted O-methyltransferase YrrM
MIDAVCAFRRTDAIALPAAHARIVERSHAIGFSMNSDILTGSLLRTLVASKAAGRFLELGTGCGLGASWMLDGMGTASTLTSVDTDPAAQAIAREELEQDPRLRLVLQDGGAFLADAREPFDVIYADAWPGKYSDMDRAIALVASGGVYLVDDMLPQPNWPDGHDARAAALIERLTTLDGFHVTPLDWSTGVIICVRIAGI